MNATPIQSVSTYDAKTHLSQILTEVERARTEVILTRHDRPIAKIVPFPQPRAPRTPGALRGRVVAPDGWDEFTAQDEADWYGGPLEPAREASRR